MKIYRSMLEELVASPVKSMKGASTESGIAQISSQWIVKSLNWGYKMYLKKKKGREKKGKEKKKVKLYL
jgi:hypothetical protein